MAGYIALILIGLLFLAGVVYLLRFLLRLAKGGGENADPLLGQLEVNAAAQNLKSAKGVAFLLYALSFVGLLWYMFVYEPEPDIQTSSVELYNEFIMDQPQATVTYRGEFVVVNGKYVGDALVFGSPAILLQTGSEREYVQCNFEGGRAEQAAALSLGQVVSLKGRVLGKTDNLVLEKCSIHK